MLSEEKEVVMFGYTIVFLVNEKECRGSRENNTELLIC